MDYTVPAGLPPDHEFTIAEDTSPDPPPRRPRTPHPPAVWENIKREYLTSNIPARALAAKHKIPYPTLRERARKQGWSSDRRNANLITAAAVRSATNQVRTHTADVVAQVVQSQASASSLTASRLIRETLDDSSDWLQHIRVTRGDPATKGDPASIRALVSALRDVVGIARMAHGLDKVEPVSVSIGLTAGIVLTPRREKVIEVGAEPAKGVE